jgi:hypothetical protein
MQSVQRIVDEVRAQLAAYDQTVTDRIRLLADDYQAACSSAETRLRRCEELIRTGHRGEALHLAELDPPLLDVISALSFPERKTWCELTAMYNLPEPPPLSVHRAQELNNVYAEYAGVSPLVTRLRHLGRARAPLTERAIVLRELCARDANCPLWPEQLVAMETELRNDIIRAFEADLKNGDRSRMLDHYAALTAPGWRRPALPVQVSRVANECLPQLSAQLTFAVSRNDLPGAQQARTQWQRMSQAARLLPNDPIIERAAVQLDRIARMERDAQDDVERRQAIDDLRDALHRNAMPDELTRRYDRVKELKARIPKPMLSQYQSSLSKDERRRDTRQMILGVVGMVLGAAALITFLVLIIRR